MFALKSNKYDKFSPTEPFEAWLYIVIFIHYKPRIAVAILDL